MGSEQLTPRARFKPIWAELSSGLQSALSATLVATGLIVGGALLDVGATAAWARSQHSASTLGTADSRSAVGLSQLPQQAQDVHRRILAGGPFRHDKDGAVFGNREQSLPRRHRGFYREYTVATPGSRDRGARRIVCGGRIVQSPETCFYTEDHYFSFRPIDPRN